MNRWTIIIASAVFAWCSKCEAQRIVSIPFPATTSLSNSPSGVVTFLLHPWDDITVAGFAIKTGGTAPNFTTFGPSGTLNAYQFSNTTDDQAWLSFQMPHSYWEGSSIIPHVHWARTAATGAGTNVIWGLEYEWQNIDAAFAGPSTIYVTNGISGTNWFHQLSEFPTVPGTGKKISSVFTCRIFRLSSSTADDYDKPAALLQVDLHYQKDTIGSATSSAK